MKCEDMDWVAYESNALDPEKKKEMDEHMAACEHCQDEWSEQKSTSDLLKRIWVERQRACIPSEQLMDLYDGKIEGADKEMLLFHIETCEHCAEKYKMVSQFYKEFDERSAEAMQFEELPDSIKSVLEKEKKAHLTDRLTKTFSALAEKGAGGIKDIKERAARIVESVTGPGLTQVPMPAIRKDAAEVEEEDEKGEEEEKEEPESQE